jgi:hypothetical protein
LNPSLSYKKYFWCKKQFYVFIENEVDWLVLLTFCGTEGFCFF